jgi:hypothetical protein
MGSSEKDPMRELLERQVSALIEQAAHGEAISADQAEAVGRLARLIEIRDAARGKPRRSWWPAGALAGALVIGTVLLFAHVTATDIELDVLASEIRFGIEKNQVLAGALRLTTLAASGLREIQLPNTGVTQNDSLQSSPAGQVALRLSGNPDSKHPGTITLAPLVLPAAATVSLRAGESAREFVLSFRAPGLNLRADGYGSLILGMPGAHPRQLDLAIPKAVLFRTSGQDVDFALAFPSTPVTPFSPQLSVHGLSLSRIDQFIDADQSLVRRISTILSGTLLLESLNGEERKLRPGEELRFEESHGEIRQLRLEDNQIGVRYHGRVRGMTTGSGEGHRSLMPTYLEWMRARHGVSLLWGTTLYLFGLIAGALRWWGVRL